MPIIADAAVMASVKNVSPEPTAHPTPGPVQACLAVSTCFWPNPHELVCGAASYMWMCSARLHDFNCLLLSLLPLVPVGKLHQPGLGAVLALHADWRADRCSATALQEGDYGKQRMFGAIG